MWPTISNIDSKIAEKIKSYPNDLSKASQLTSWIRVFSGAVVDGKPGLIMQSNTNWKLLKAAGESVSSIYGSVDQSGTLGVDWNGNAVTPMTGRKLRPSPIITSFNSKEGKDQISRTCDFSITCFSLEQLDYLQSYFMEPGYSVAVEWGWNTVDSMKGMVQTSKNSINKSILDQIADSTLNNQNLNQKRKTTIGEYDIFLGFIVGSTVSNDGENFKIDVRLRGEPSLPTYLQSHNGTNEINESGVIINSRKVNRLYSDVEMESLSNVGKRRFAYMFNSLPAFRQTIDVKKLENSVTKEQFINFDKKIENEVNSGISGGYFRSDSVTIEYKGLSKEIATENLFSINKYIKMDLAVSILNTIGVIDKYNIGDKEITFKININNTIIGAFPYIFSTKADKLIIPGKLPDFLQYFLQLNTIEQSSGGLNGGGFLKVDGEWKPPIEAPDGINSFVNLTNYLNKFGLNESAGYYGYLKDLYVNFDMFKSKIEQKNKNIREIFLDILNEMSAAVNGLWNFQIVEGEFIETEKNSDLPNTNNPFVSFSTVNTLGNTKSNKKAGDIEITVIDENWIGENPNPEKIVEFNHNGTTSPFLNSNLDISIPADMANMIVLKRMGGTSQPDMKHISIGKNSLFSAETDLFLKKRQSEINDEEGKDTVVDRITELQKLLANEDAKITTKKSTTTSASLTQTITTIEYRDSAGNLIKTDRTVSNISGIETITTYTNKSIQKTNEELQTEIKNKNESVLTSLTAFLDKLDVVPLSIKEKLSEVGDKTFTYNDNLTIDKIKQNFTSYCFDDTEYFNRLKNDAFEKKYENGKPNGLSHPLPIKYSFTILGNSGIRRGDTFNINGIPSKYKDNGLFQVTEIEHTISDMKWTTTVTGQYRQIQ